MNITQNTKNYTLKSHNQFHVEGTKLEMSTFSDFISHRTRNLINSNQAREKQRMFK